MFYVLCLFKEISDGSEVGLRCRTRSKSTRALEETNVHLRGVLEASGHVVSSSVVLNLSDSHRAPWDQSAATIRHERQSHVRHLLIQYHLTCVCVCVCVRACALSLFSV